MDDTPGSDAEERDFETFWQAASAALTEAEVVLAGGGIAFEAVQAAQVLCRVLAMASFTTTDAMDFIDRVAVGARIFVVSHRQATEIAATRDRQG